MAPCYTMGSMYRLMADYGDDELYTIVGTVNLDTHGAHGTLVMGVGEKSMETIVAHVPADSLDVHYVNHFATLAGGYREMVARLTAYAEGAREPAFIACRITA